MPFATHSTADFVTQSEREMKALTLTDSNNPAHGIFIGDTNYSATSIPGLYVYAVGDFAVDSRGLMPSTSSFKEFRITIDGKNVTVERGDSLSNLTELATATLGSTVAGRTFALRLSTDVAPYFSGVFDWFE